MIIYYFSYSHSRELDQAVPKKAKLKTIASLPTVTAAKRRSQSHQLVLSRENGLYQKRPT